MAPESAVHPETATSAPTTPSIWKRITWSAWSPSDGGVTVRQPRESAGLRVPAQEALPSAMPATEFTLQTLLDQRTALQLHAEIAELTAREALARKTTAEHLLAARDIEISLSRQSRSPPPSPPADKRLSRMPRFPSGTSEQQQMLQFFEEQRREDRRMVDEREERYQRAVEEREALRESHYAAQLAALTVKATADRHPCGYTPSKGFEDIPLFSLGGWCQLTLAPRRAKPREGPDPARAGPSAPGATSTAPGVGGTVPSPPPLPRPSTGERLPPPAFLPPGLAAPAPLSWSHGDSARRLPHRPRDDVSRAAVAGAWDAQAALDDLRAAQAADRVYASVDAHGGGYAGAAGRSGGLSGVPP
jgi:hypothetical protein